jgi:ATP-dependent helicase HrpB
VVLATSIAETSLTIEGVRVVIDCGLARVPRFDPSSGLTRLETVRVSRAAADQRRGRAGRTEPGVCYRLWDEPETRALPAFARPEILEADLSNLALNLARWGARDVGDLAFLDKPPAAAFNEARILLNRLQALDGQGGLTAHGRALADMPLAPRLAHMVVRAAASGQAERGAKIAAVLSEQGLGGRDVDLRHRLESFDRDRSPRARDARTCRSAGRVRGAASGAAPLDDALLLAEAYPERVARARGKPGEYQLAGGRGVYLEPTDALARETWLAVGELGGGEARDRILLAAPLDEAALREAFADRLVAEDRLEPDARGKVRARRLLRLGKLVVEERLLDKVDPAWWPRPCWTRSRARACRPCRWARAPRPCAAAWPSCANATRDLARPVGRGPAGAPAEWLEPLLAGRSALSQLGDGALTDAIRTLVPWDLHRRLDAEAPARFTAPTGSSFAIDYAADGGPRVDVRVQELFGLTAHPTVGGARWCWRCCRRATSRSRSPGTCRGSGRAPGARCGRR